MGLALLQESKVSPRPYPGLPSQKRISEGYEQRSQNRFNMEEGGPRHNPAMEGETFTSQEGIMWANVNTPFVPS